MVPSSLFPSVIACSNGLPHSSSVALASPAPVTGGGEGTGSQARARALSEHHLQLQHHRARKGARRRWVSGQGGGQVQEDSGLAHSLEQQASGRAEPRTQAPLLLTVCLSSIQNCGKT